ncbi:hypothetical protein AB0F71_01860 [Kitasatospora sp. NPDC028055]|uniref:hypothetical protein n=1 Tax=Kitasatospora sp. NPDC028055 TaxID=3155653 RepID=UPI0033C2E96A
MRRKTTIEQPNPQDRQPTAPDPRLAGGEEGRTYQRDLSRWAARRAHIQQALDSSRTQPSELPVTPAPAPPRSRRR